MLAHYNRKMPTRFCESVYARGDALRRRLLHQGLFQAEHILNEAYHYEVSYTNENMRARESPSTHAKTQMS